MKKDATDCQDGARRPAAPELTSDQQSRETFDQEHPPPASVSKHSSHLQQPCAEERCHDIGERIDGVKDGEADGEIVLVVPIR